DTGETNNTNKPGDWEQVRGGDTDNNKRAHGTDKQTQGKHMAGTRKHEDKTREQTCDNTRETNSEITHRQNTDLTNSLQSPDCELPTAATNATALGCSKERERPCLGSQ